MLSHLSYVRLFATLWTVAHQAPLCMGFSRQEHWSGLPCPPPEDIPNPGMEPASLVSSIGRWVLYQVPPEKHFHWRVSPQMPFWSHHTD